MARRRKARRVLKWAGAVTCIALVLLGAISFYRSAFIGGGNWFAFVDCGSISVFARTEAWPTWPDGGFLSRPHLGRGIWVDWWPSYETQVIGDESFGLEVPIWMPLALALIPTAWLWWRDRRRTAPGHCRCGYDLTGNVSGRCPECGATVNTARSRDEGPSTSVAR